MLTLNINRGSDQLNVDKDQADDQAQLLMYQADAQLWCDVNVMHKWSHVLVIGQSRPYMICLMQTWSHVLVIGLMYSTASLDHTCFIWDCIFKKSQVSCFIDWCSTTGFNVLDPIPGCDAGHQPHCSGSAAVEVLHQQPQCLIFCISTAAVHWPHSHQIETWGYWTLSLSANIMIYSFYSKLKWNTSIY